MSLAFSVYNIQVLSLLINYIKGENDFKYAEDFMQLEWILAVSVIPFVLAISVMNEVIPRWLILCLSMIVLTVLTKFIRPMTSFGWFVIQLASRVAFYGLVFNPLVNDFVKRETVGIAVGIETTGYVCGQLVVGIILSGFFKEGPNGYEITAK